MIGRMKKAVVVKARKVVRVKAIQNPKINQQHLTRHLEVRGKILTIISKVQMENKKKKKQNDDNRFLFLCLYQLNKNSIEIN